MFSLGIALAALLFGVIGFYLTLIAKFYRLKFHRGPQARWMQASLAVLLAGILLLRLDALVTSLPSWYHWVPAVLMCAGGIAFSVLSYRLYRTMLSS
jgi:hypothetical protein